MKPRLKVKLYDSYGEVCAKGESEVVSDITALLKETEFVRGTVRATYIDGMYNEASFTNATHCKLLITLFREKPLLHYIYGRDL